MSPQDWWTAGTKGEHHREDLDISGSPRWRRSFPRWQKGETSEANNQPGNQPGPQRGTNIQLKDIPPQRRRNYRVTDLSVLNLYHCNNVSIISRQHRNRNKKLPTTIFCTPLWYLGVWLSVMDMSVKSPTVKQLYRLNSMQSPAWPDDSLHNEFGLLYSSKSKEGGKMCIFPKVFQRKHFCVTF